MSVEIIYYNTAPNQKVQEVLSSLDKVNVTSGEDRREFLVALSKAVTVSNTTVAVGDIAQLIKVLSKGLGLPLESVDWSNFGIVGKEETALPKGALPLLVGDQVGGMIIENADQCIIAVNNEQAALEFLTKNYIVPYLQAVIKDVQPAQVVEEPVEEAVAEESVEEVTEEPVFEEPAQTFEDFDSQPEQEEESDLFSDIEEDDFLEFKNKGKKKGVLIALIAVLSVLVLCIAGGIVGYTKWWLTNMYEVSIADSKERFEKSTAEDAATAGMPEEYSVKFAALYKQNADVISWLKVEGLGIDTPVVTGVRHSPNYYENHLFDGKSNPYGTPYIKYAYDTAANINPNLVIYGNNKGDGKAFGKLESLLDGISKVKSVKTDSALFGEEKWDVISVMLVDKEGKEYNFANNFKELDADARTEMIKTALKKSKVNTGATIDSVELTDNFLTLVTPYSKDKNKVVVIVAKRIVEQATDIVE